MRLLLNPTILMIWLITGLAGCSTQTVRVVDMTPPKQLAQSLPEDQLLDVGMRRHVRVVALTLGIDHSNRT